MKSKRKNEESQHFEQELLELAIIGQTMLKGEIIPELASVSGLDFTAPGRADVWDAIAALSADGTPIDEISVYKRMTEDGTAETHTQSWLLQVAADTPCTVNLAHWARLLRESSTQRRCAASLTDAATATKRAENPREAVTAAMAILGDVAEQEPEGLQSVRGIASAVFKRIENRHTTKTLPGISWGFAATDAFARLQPSEFTILAARPSMGKTALALRIALNVARNGGRVLIFSLEMDKESLVERMLASDAGVPLERVRTFLADQHWPKLAKSLGSIYELPLDICDTGGMSIGEIQAHARSRRNPAMILVDYIQLCRAKADNREQEIAAISRGLKNLAKSMKCPVLALSQLNRELEKRGDKRPQLSDLRESGSLEQDGDVIAFIYRDDYYDKNSERPGIAEISFSKNRNGPTGIAELRWFQNMATFADIERSYQ